MQASKLFSFLYICVAKVYTKCYHVLARDNEVWHLECPLCVALVAYVFIIV
nr:MAG TPA: hypothetical protein [Caudoviricetes sp.]DAJ95032.1 MAG TPA: hypothetical protein [Caudoviricetes sp.]DAK07410.1 MAG TPA: hypothetical protein [Caudoviricetes sp.]